MGFNWIIKTQFSSSENQPCQARRSTGPIDRTQSRSTDVHKDVHADQPLRPVDRLKVPHSRVGAVDRTVDREAWHGRPSDRPAREQLLSGIGAVDRAVDRQAQRSYF